MNVQKIKEMTGSGEVSRRLGGLGLDVKIFPEAKSTRARKQSDAGAE